MADKCDKGYKGNCCCNCSNQFELMKHPWNKDKKLKGSISKSTGYYACIVQLEEETMSILYDNKHGCCELHTRIKDKQ